MGKLFTAKCAWCGEETILFVRGVPICPKCDEQREEPEPGAAPPSEQGDREQQATPSMEQQATPSMEQQTAQNG
jgi:hypothetical protein